MRRTVKNKRPITASKQLCTQKLHNNNNKATTNDNKPSLSKQKQNQKVLISDLSQTFSSPFDKYNTKQNIFNPDTDHIGIDLNKQVIPTQNVPIALPIPTISKLYLGTNIILCLLYAILTVICSKVLQPFQQIDQTSVPIIVIVSITLVVYVVYVLMMIKCSRIRAFERKLIGVREFETFFYQMKCARTWFRVELLGDRAKWSQKDEVRELIYQPKVIDQSGRFYPLPQVISYCDASSKNIKTRQVSKYSQQQIISSQAKPPSHQHQQQKHSKITIVLADYQKKYYFSSDQSKMNYLNSVQEFFHLNQELFDHQKPIKGYKKMEFLVEDFEEEKAYLMVAVKKKEGREKVLQEKGQKLNNKSDHSLLYKLQNDSFFMVNHDNDPNSLVVLNDDDIRQQRVQHQPVGLIYKHNNRHNHNSNNNNILEERLNENIKSVGGGNEKQNKRSESAQQQYEKEEQKYAMLFLVTYWIFLILGFGAFYEWFILVRYMKCIQVTITKQIHERQQQKNDPQLKQHDKQLSQFKE